MLWVILLSFIPLAFVNWLLTAQAREIPDLFRAQHNIALVSGDGFSAIRAMNGFLAHWPWVHAHYSRNGQTLFQAKGPARAWWPFLTDIKIVGGMNNEFQFDCTLTIRTETAVALGSFLLTEILLIMALSAQRRRVFYKEQEGKLQLADEMGRVAHDLRSPIRVLRSLINSQKNSDPRWSTALQSLQDLSSRLLIPYKNREPQKNTLKKVSCDSFVLQKELELILSHKQVEYEAQEFRWIVEKQDIGVGLPLDCTRGEFLRCCSIVLNNAAEASSPLAQIVIRVEIQNHVSIWFSELEKFLVISVMDSGIGISKFRLWKMRFRIFDSNKPNGHGIGLRFVQETLERTGGALHLTSELGHGSCVKMWFRISTD